MSRALPRRLILRGLGTALALPWLDAMVPAFASARAAAPIRRFATIYVPNGMAMANWTPAAEGPAFELTPILQPLAPHRRRLRVLSGLSTLGLPRIPAYHAAAATNFFTGTAPSSARGTVVRAGVSVDQVAATVLGEDTRVPSLELALEDTEIVGACDVQYSCAYQNTICWATPTTPLPMEPKPRAVFERLFGDSADRGTEARLRSLREDRSVLDSVRESLGRLQQGLGSADRARLGEYVDSLRSVERRIGDAEARAAQDVPDPRALGEPPATFLEHYELMIDLIALAFHADLTRVATLMVGCEASVRSYPQLGVPEAHHQVSHHQNDPIRVEKLTRINVQHVKGLAYLLERLGSIEDGGGPLLDQTAVLYGGGMSDSNLHRHDNLPVLVAGLPALSGGAHVRYAGDTPMANLSLSLLDLLGARVDAFGNSTGALL